MKRILLALLIGLLPASYSISQENWGKVRYGQITINQWNPAIVDAVKSQDKQPTRLYISRDAGEDALENSVQFDFVTELNLQSQHVGSIEPLAKMKSLKSIRLYLKKSNEKRIDLTPLQSIPSLEKVECYATKVANVDVLAELPNLKEVSLYMASVDSIDFVAKAPNLVALNLYGTDHQFESYEPITKAKKLKLLDIYMNRQATDENLAVLQSVTTLEELRMSNCKAVTSLDFVANCKNMKKIDANWCSKLINIDAIKTMPNLEQLNLDDVPIRDFSPIQDLIKLNRLQLDGALVEDLGVLSKLTNLENLSVSDSLVSDISALENLINLKYLTLSATKTSDVSVLARLIKLSSLNLSKSPVEDISAVAGLNDLRTLNLRETKVKDLSPLKKTPRLASIYLNDSAVTDISALAGLENLYTVDLSGTKVADFGPLTECPKLRTVTLPLGTTDEVVKNLKSKLPKATIRIARR